MNIGALLQITQVCAMHVLQPQLPVVCSGFSLSELEHDQLFAVWLQSTCCLHEFATHAANAQLAALHEQSSLVNSR